MLPYGDRHESTKSSRIKDKVEAIGEHHDEIDAVFVLMDYIDEFPWRLL